MQCPGAAVSHPAETARLLRQHGRRLASIPCLCDLWLANTTQAPITVGIQLTVTPPEQVPTLTGPLDVEIAFDDPDASLYAA